MSTLNPSFGEHYRNLLKSTRVVEEISIRAFRAIDDPASARAFADGHIEVLRNFGLNLSSANEHWMTSPNVYVILIESLDRKEVFGGSRIERYTTPFSVPIQSAIDEEAPEIADFLNSRKENSIGEICGLWNSIAIAGWGIGSVYSIRCAISIAPSVGLNELVALCSPYTYRIAHKYGFRLVETIGNAGAVPYAGANEIAHVTHQSNISDLPGADIEEKSIIMGLRKRPQQIKTEHGRKGTLKVHYNLHIR